MDAKAICHELTNFILVILCASTPADGRTRFCKALCSLPPPQDFHHTQLSTHRKDTGRHCYSMVNFFHLCQRVHMLANPLKLGARYPSKLWRQKTAFTIRSSPLDPYRFCHPDSSLVCDQGFTAPQKG